MYPHDLKNTIEVIQNSIYTHKQTNYTYTLHFIIWEHFMFLGWSSYLDFTEDTGRQ
jgi:hypothetical protein